MLRETLKGDTSLGSLNRDLVERVYIPRGPPGPNPNSQESPLKGTSFAV